MEFEGHCGAVRVFINGNAQVKRIEIDDEVRSIPFVCFVGLCQLSLCDNQVTSMQCEEGVEDTAICDAINEALGQVLEFKLLFWLFAL